MQQNIVRENGRRSVLLSVIKNGNASTLDVVNGVKEALDVARAAAPAGLKINELFDQSMFVTNSVDGVVREGAIAAGLTALMILLFLGSWRSTLVVMISIPLAMLTLARRALFPRPYPQHHDARRAGARGRHPGRRFDGDDREHAPAARRGEACRLPQATLHGSAGIAVPTLVSTLAISCVFTSVVFLEGPAKYLFTPLGLAVVFAMLASYGAVAHPDADHHRPAAEGRARTARRGAAAAGSPASTRAFERGFERMREAMRAAQTVADAARSSCRSSPSLVLALGAECSSSSAATSSRSSMAVRSSSMSARQPEPASRATEQIFQAVEDKIREVIPEQGPRADRRQYRAAGARLQSRLHRRLDDRRQ